VTKVTWEQFKEAVVMSEQQNPGTDQTTGEAPVDPNTPAQSSQVPADAQEQQAQQGQSDVKSPDQDSEEAREGGGYGNPNSQETPQEEEQDQS
jgi:hypothetical protein